MATDRRLGGRDPYFEQQFLREAQRLAGLPSSGYADEVQARLHRAERELGADSYLEHSMGRLISEIEEEGLDIGGWATVAALAAYAKVQDDRRRGEVHLILQELAAYGPLIGRMCERLRGALAD